MMSSIAKLAEDYVKSHSRKVKDVMTRDVISVTDTPAVADIAVLLETNRIKRVPVVRDARPVGIVSRANLVRALAMTIEIGGMCRIADGQRGSAGDNERIRIRQSRGYPLTDIVTCCF